jgi:lysophospholipase L1-like esterase
MYTSLRAFRKMLDHVLLLGDSVTVGTGFSGVDEGTCYVTLLDRCLREAEVDARLTPSALDGVDSGYALRRFDRMVARFAPDIVGIVLGLNDAKPPGNRVGCSPERFAQNLSQLVERCLEIDASPVLSTPTPRTDCPFADGRAGAIMAPYAECVRRIADSYHLPVVELYDRFMACDELESLLPDGLHPGPAGHRILAQQFARTLIPVCSGRLQLALTGVA